MKCSINFLENSMKIYTPGDSVELAVVIEIDHPTNVDEIYLKVIGYAHCDFKSIKHDKHVHGHANYIDRKIKLLGIAELTEGTHRFEGNFTLPYNIPSSIECLNGHWKEASGCIRYRVEVHVSQLGHPDSKFESPFNVVCPLNLNSMSPELHAPIMQEICRNFSFDWNNGCYLSASIPQRAFAPGEKIPVTVNCDNMTRTRIKSIRVALNRIMFMTSNTPLKEIMRVVIAESFEYCDQVKPHCHRIFSKWITVPALEPNIENCELIRVTYEVHVKAKTSGFHRSINLRIPVMIGTIPLGDDKEDYRSETTSYYGYGSSSYGTYSSRGTSSLPRGSTKV